MDNLVLYSKDKPEYRAFRVSYTEIAKSLELKNLLSKALDLEIIYDQIIEAYWDYKNKVNYWNLRSFSSLDVDYILNHEIRSSLNRLAFNLFNLSKLYLDWHYNQKKKRCFSFELTNEESSREAVIAQRSEIYDTNLNYVVGYNLRGHSQHSTLPVRSFTTGVRHDKGTSNPTAHFSIYYYYEDLEKAGVPKAMLHRDIKLDLTDIIDGFVYAISQKHMLNRTLTAALIKNARTSITSMWQSYATIAGFENYSVELILENEKRISLCLDWFEVFNHLKAKHFCATNYSSITFEK